MTPEQQQRIEQIRERWTVRTSNTKSWGEWPTLQSVGGIKGAIDDIDFLLSIVKSQEADDTLQGNVYDAALAELCDPDVFSNPEKANELAWVIAARVAGTKTVVINKERRLVIPCPDGRPDCEVLHTAPLARPPVTNTGRGRCIHNVPICGECEIAGVLAHVTDKERVSHDAATSMRSACVEKVRALAQKYRDDGDKASWKALIAAIGELESVSIQEQK